ncbi:MAG TPA: hypothetical protein VH107_03535 [Lacipirellulaceae bacterium]|jgi:uncharacterized paraquat-inducible protein A|nr:hypothetical protein [Lacipirellulaceae bacterium]
MKAIYHQFEPVVLRWILAAIVVVLVLLLASVAAACPTCKDGLAQNDPHGHALAAGYAYSVIFMMSMPYLLLCTMASMAYLAIRRAKNANAMGDVGVAAISD